MNIPERKRARGEMLPLMDVIFLLMTLFIFMLVQMRPDFGMSVELPQVGASTKTQDKKTDKTRVWVTVDAEGTVFVNKENATDGPSAAQAVLAAAECAPAEVQVIFKGDQAAGFGRIVEVFNALRAAGCTDVLFDVNKGD